MYDIMNLAMRIPAVLAVHHFNGVRVILIQSRVVKYNAASGCLCNFWKILSGMYLWNKSEFKEKLIIIYLCQFEFK